MMAQAGASISLILVVIFGILSLMSSSLTLYLMYSLQRWNDFMKVIALLTIAQFFYDLSILIVPTSITDRLAPAYTIDLFVRCFAGMASVLWTNVISYVMIQAALHYKIHIIDHNKFFIVACVILPSFFIALLNASLKNVQENAFTAGYHFYNWICITGIAYNILCYIYLSWQLFWRDAHFGNWRQQVLQLSIYSPTIRTDPLRALVVRLKYYPLVQSVCRLGTMWYDLRYGYGFRQFSVDSAQQVTALVLYSIALPSAGIGYLIVFVGVTPGAWAHTKKLAKRLFGYSDIGEASRPSYLGGKLPASMGFKKLHSNPDLIANLLQSSDIERAALGSNTNHNDNNRGPLLGIGENLAGQLRASNAAEVTDGTTAAAAHGEDSFTVDYGNADEHVLANEISRMYIADTNILDYQTR